MTNNIPKTKNKKDQFKYFNLIQLNLLSQIRKKNNNKN